MVPHTLESEVADFHRLRVGVEATMVGENGSKLLVVVVGMVMVVAYNV
jgi:hypothetical protein